MFPFRGMPAWAQTLGEVLPLTHFLRIVRGILLGAAAGLNCGRMSGLMALFILVAGAVALKRYRLTLD